MKMVLRAAFSQIGIGLALGIPAAISGSAHPVERPDRHFFTIRGDIEQVSSAMRAVGI